MHDIQTRRLAFVGSALGLALAGLVAGSAVAGSILTAADGGMLPAYPVNDAGLTFGSLVDATSPDTEPDLILVETTDGETGYVYKAALDRASGADIRSPQEAAEWKPARTEVPVYLVDGTTQIGVFVVGEGSVFYER